MKKMLASAFLLITASAGFSKPKQETITASSIERMMKWIPGRTVIAASSVDSGKGNANPFSMAGYFIQETEATNFHYLFFLNDLLRKGDVETYQKALPDTSVWVNQNAYMASYVQHYLRHPAFQAYPVVGVSYTQSLLFCKWISEWYNSDPRRKHKEVRFELPTEMEWMNAASAGKDSAIFPWGGHYLRNAKGEFLANFTQINEASIVPDSCGTSRVYRYLSSSASAFDGAPADNTYITAPARSYWPNQWGLYQMAGNVEEFVAEEGISKGGSWMDTGYFLQISSREQYLKSSSASAQRGFRVKMVIVSY